MLTPKPDIVNEGTIKEVYRKRFMDEVNQFMKTTSIPQLLWVIYAGLAYFTACNGLTLEAMEEMKRRKGWDYNTICKAAGKGDAIKFFRELFNESRSDIPR